MKHAILPTGQTLSFPDETPDEHMDAAVQQHMGVQPPPDPLEVLMQVAQQIERATAAMTMLAGTISQAVQQQTTVMQQLGMHVAGLGQAAAQTAQTAGVAVQAHAMAADRQAQATDDLHKGFIDSHEKMVKAITAPRKIVTDKQGKPVGTAVDDGGK